MRDYYVVQLKMPSGKTLTSSLMLLEDAEKLCCECNQPDTIANVIFICQQ